MNTGNYITPDDILSVASIMSGDKDYKSIPKGFYYSLIQKAFEDLSIDSFFAEKRIDLDLPKDSLSLLLPEDCFNLRNVYVFDGTGCNISNSKKVYWKKNYYTKGNGYIANDKGDNGNDPYFDSHRNAHQDKSYIRIDSPGNVNSVLYYNVQMGEIMFSSSCRNAGTKIHLHYNSTGCTIGEAPIIPVYFRTAIEDYVIESALRVRIANETGDIRKWQMLYSEYSKRLDKDGMFGSWFKAIMRVKKMNTSQKNELAIYLGRGGWANGA